LDPDIDLVSSYLELKIAKKPFERDASNSIHRAELRTIDQKNRRKTQLEYN